LGILGGLALLLHGAVARAFGTQAAFLNIAIALLYGVLLYNSFPRHRRLEQRKDDDVESYFGPTPQDPSYL
jgi:hypothetical protein